MSALLYLLFPQTQPTNKPSSNCSRPPGACPLSTRIWLVPMTFATLFSTIPIQHSICGNIVATGWTVGIKVFSGLTKAFPVDGQTQQVRDIDAMFAAMYQPVTYGATSVTGWENTTPGTDFESLRNQLTQGIDVNAVKFRPGQLEPAG